MAHITNADAEEALFSVLKELKNKVATLSNRSRTVGSFWKEHFSRAPFEEELTLSQLASLDPETLVKKKSFTEDKMIALTQAVHEALSQGELKLVSSVPHHFEDHHPPETLSFLKNDEQLTDSQTIELLGIFSAVRFFSPHHNFLGFFISLYQSLGVKLFLDALLNRKNWHKNHHTLQQIDELFSELLPEVSLHWRTALSGAGTSIHGLVEPYRNKHSSQQTFQASYLLASTILTALGALPVKIRSRTIPQHFTLHPETAIALIKAVKLKKDAHRKEELQQALSGVFPLFDFEILSQALSIKKMN